MQAGLAGLEVLLPPTLGPQLRQLHRGQGGDVPLPDRGRHGFPGNADVRLQAVIGGSHVILQLSHPAPRVGHQHVPPRRVQPDHHTRQHTSVSAPSSPHVLVGATQNKQEGGRILLPDLLRQQVQDVETEPGPVLLLPLVVWRVLEAPLACPLLLGTDPEYGDAPLAPVPQVRKSRQFRDIYKYTERPPALGVAPYMTSSSYFIELFSEPREPRGHLLHRLQQVEVGVGLALGVVEPPVVTAALVVCSPEHFILEKVMECPALFVAGGDQLHQGFVRKKPLV